MQTDLCETVKGSSRVLGLPAVMYLQQKKSIHEEIQKKKIKTGNLL